MEEKIIAQASAVVSTHPRGLYTLFFTELWERFSFYGMRALLVLFMVDEMHGGMRMTDQMAMAIYGLYTAGVYLAALPGGWLADRLFGAQKSVWYGGIIIAAGHFTLVIPRPEAFYLGLILVVIGTGLLKPNISIIVGELYPEGGARRDAGFTIFYMGINIGAALGPLVCSALGEKVNWHYGFGAAGVGMVLGLIQYRLSSKHLAGAGLPSRERKAFTRTERIGLASVVAALLLITGFSVAGVIKINPVTLARSTTLVIVAVALFYFLYMFLFANLDRTEKQRVGVIAVLFVASAIFWAGFEQAGSSFNLFADRYTDRMIAFSNFEIPTGWFQSLGPVFVISLAPVAAWIWIALARRNLNPSLPVKFGLSLILLAFGFVVMAVAAKLVISGQKASPSWLVTVYLVHTLGELCLSPVGLSSVTKLAPRRLVGQMMGIWFLGTSLGNLIAGQVAGEIKMDTAEQMPRQFLQCIWIPVAAATLLILLAKPIKKWMVGVK